MKAGVLVAVLALSLAPVLWSQGSGSSTQARALVDEAIAALGSDAFLHLKTEKDEARVFSFRRNNLSGLATVVEYFRYPDEQRNEYGKKQEEVEILKGNKGWIINSGGMRQIPAGEMRAYRERESMSAFHILRYRLGEPGSALEYAGKDVVDNREVDLVNFIDRENRTATIALDRSTHLPSQVVWVRRAPRTGERIDETEILSNYSKEQGITAPRHLLRKQNGTKIFEAFIREVRYNLDLSDLLFIPPISLR